uniref:EB domain-containing protein n=1 Tax=Panagrellus redivivus TaxID=6233 RepID=A0A7E4VQ77_PANRE
MEATVYRGVHLGQSHCVHLLRGYCNAHIDASCLPSYIMTPPICKDYNDCKHLSKPDSYAKVQCIDKRCRIVLDCPHGFFAWQGGCLPFSTANQKCPAGSEQCIQGLLCVDGVCLGACAEGEILVNGACVTYGPPSCIDRDCSTEGCPLTHPVCTLHESTSSYSCCKRKAKSSRRNRHIDSVGSFGEKPTPVISSKLFKKTRPWVPASNVNAVIDIPKHNLAKSRKRPTPMSFVQVFRPLPVATAAPVVNVVNAPIVSVASLSCSTFGEVLIGSRCYARVQAGQACSYSAQCPSTTSTTGNSPYKCINAICQLDVTCSAGYFKYNNTCVKYSATGQTCSIGSGQCLTGSSCVSGTCYSGCQYNQLLIENVCVGYADYGCIQRSCETDSCPTAYPVCNFVRAQNAFVCCSEALENAMMCPGGIQPQLSFGSNIPVDCIAKTCARGYTCTHTLGGSSSRYICCPKSQSIGQVTPSPVNGYLTVCLKQSIRAGCTPVSNELCFCAYPGGRPGGTTVEPPLPTFTTGLPNVTTTTVATTTTVESTTEAACMTCGWNDIVLFNQTYIGEFPSVPDGIVTNSDGCAQMTVVCDASTEEGAIVYMWFNENLGGPSANSQAKVTATLECIDGSWTYTESGVTTVITRVSCDSSLDDSLTTTAPDTETTAAPSECADCTADVTLTPAADNTGGVLPTSSMETVDGCQQMTVTCTVTTGVYVYMSFNDNAPQGSTGGPTANFLPTVTATLACNGGSWYYTEGSQTDAISEVTCIQGTSYRKRITGRKGIPELTEEKS